MYCEIPDLRRCCCCFPLRIGILVFGYINICFSFFVVLLYSNLLQHWAVPSELLLYHGLVMKGLTAVNVAVYSLELAAYCVLVFGAHARVTWCVRAFYYYAVTTTVLTLVLLVVDLAAPWYGLLQIMFSVILCFASLVLQIYLIILVRSLLKRLELSGSHAFDNQLQEMASRDYAESAVGARGDAWAACYEA